MAGRGLASSGSIVVLDRGVCSFQDKAEAVQLAGGSGLIVVNNAKGLFIMPRGFVQGGNGSSSISIPAVWVSCVDAILSHHEQVIDFPSLGALVFAVLSVLVRETF